MFFIYDKTTGEVFEGWKANGQPGFSMPTIEPFKEGDSTAPFAPAIYPSKKDLVEVVLPLLQKTFSNRLFGVGTVALKPE